MEEPVKSKGCTWVFMIFIGVPLACTVSGVMFAKTSDDVWRAIAVILFCVILHYSIKVGNYFDEHNNSVQSTKRKRKRNWQKKITGPTDISIRYQNSKGEVKTFEGWRQSIEVTGNHMNILVAPDKVRIALNQDRILNQDELGPLPEPGEDLVALEHAFDAAELTPEEKAADYDYSLFRYRGPEAERCPECAYLFLVEQNEKQHCPYCKKDFTPQQLGWSGDAAIGYRNREGEYKVFNAVWNSMTSKGLGSTISIRVEPTFQRITLTRSRIVADKAIRYRNFRGEEKEFEALACSMQPSNAHVNVWVAPTFTRIALKKENILEQRDLQTAAPTVTEEPIAPVLEESQAELLALLKTRASTITPVVEGPEAQPEQLKEPVKPEPEPVTTEPATVNVVITAIGMTSYEATKVLQAARPNLGAFAVYGLLRDFPKVVVENLQRAKAEKIKQELENAGCTVELK
ncbi:ribosomal protein L7/L12 [Verrucomicrobia bacterium]|nr:ribosomal protein L7/L12 [Verrucomicrobiota bacterium]MDC0218791.1 ribosomal protein L7/L12 [Verrucomicrobiota bacterium]